ncbi:MAG: hypothetical protein IJR96_06615 [Pseudobutyrivibrio sp.]|nr:hypothetical protein [Pseudobutyrivibrio sp.]
MAVRLNDEVVEAINNPASIKVLASVDRQGNIHNVCKGSIRTTDDGQIKLWELLESSQSNKNLTYALWFNKEISINVITEDRRSYQIKGIPVKNLNAGREYEENYIKAQEKNPQNDLAAVYYIDPTEIIEESYLVRLEEEQKKHPLYIHLDRVAKKD